VKNEVAIFSDFFKKFFVLKPKNASQMTFLAPNKRAEAPFSMLRLSFQKKRQIFVNTGS